MAMRSVLEIVNEALQELGLPIAQTVISAPDDETGWQTLGAVNSLGVQLLRAHDWENMMFTAEMVGDGIADEFEMPEDFFRIVNQTQWSTKNKRPMFGPMTPQGWSWIQYGIVSVGVFYRYRINLGKFQVFPTPTDGEKFNFFYIGKNWVYDPVATAEGGGVPVYKDKVDLDTDMPVFDDALMVAGIKFKLWAQKGMNAQELGREFEFMVNSAKAQQAGAPIISLNRNWNQLYITQANIPDDSWNQ